MNSALPPAARNFRMDSDFNRQQRYLGTGNDQQRTAGNCSAAPTCGKRDLFDRVIQCLERIAGLGHAVLLVHHVLGAEAVRMAGIAFHVIVGFHAEWIGFAVSVEKADFLRDAERNAQDGIGDVGFAGATDLHLASFALQERCSRELHATHPRLCGIQHRDRRIPGSACRSGGPSIRRVPRSRASSDRGRM